MKRTIRNLMTAAAVLLATGQASFADTQVAIFAGAASGALNRILNLYRAS